MPAHHHHSHAPANYGRTFAIGVSLNVAFVLVEALMGWRVHSLALVADAGHNLGDVGGLLLAWAGLAVGTLRSNERRTYGWRRASILASFANAVILLMVMGSLALAAVQRLRTPAPMEGGVVMLVAGVGVLVNAVTAWLFMAGSRSDLNLRGAYLHMAADALVSVGVVLAGALYVWRGWMWIDPVVTFAIVLVIVVGTWSLFRQSLHLLFDGVPETIDLRDVDRYLCSLPGVESVHDLHVWATGTSSTALTAHLVMPAGYPGSAFIVAASKALHDQFEIIHPTLQIETELLDDDCCKPLTSPSPH
ncbi:MAG: cation transporter [Gemmatimonadaceae bacterium]|nr:cation transporter [Gemmatimonadaceae bacterium]